MYYTAAYLITHFIPLIKHLLVAERMLPPKVTAVLLPLEDVLLNSTQI